MNLSRRRLFGLALGAAVAPLLPKLPVPLPIEPVVTVRYAYKTYGLGYVIRKEDLLDLKTREMANAQWRVVREMYEKDQERLFARYDDDVRRAA
jgi:hypothetical protein